MSLINDALKKAQQQQGRRAPATRSAVAPSGTGLKLTGPVLILAVLVIGGGLIAVAKFLTDTEAPVEASAPVKPPVPAPVAPKPAGATATPAPAVVTPVAPVPEVSVPSIVPPPVVQPEKARVAEIVPPVPVVPIPVTPPGPAQSEEVRNVIELMRVTLGRVATSRCMINGSVYKVGDRIYYDPQIDLKAVNETAIILTDKNGVEYEKRYK